MPPAWLGTHTYCDLAGAVPMDVEEGVGGCVQRGCGGSGEQAVHGELRGARQLQWLQLRRVMLRVLMYELVQESLVLLLRGHRDSSQSPCSTTGELALFFLNIRHLNVSLTKEHEHLTQKTGCTK